MTRILSTIFFFITDILPMMTTHLIFNKLQNFVKRWHPLGSPYRQGINKRFECGFKQKIKKVIILTT
uniref:Uncharacterized protein n=1 Tax=Yersinia enterocolitica TaxID=630 RepID=B0RKW5_YEREN|nr:hypothetical protein [Yersinia enterocolitica]